MRNKYKYPDVVVRAIENSAADYHPGDSFISASSITKPPRIFWLEKRYRDEISASEDVSDRVMSLLGTSVHYMLEKAVEGDKDSISEVRYSGEIRGKKVSAQIDHYCHRTKTLSDFKVTTIKSLSGIKKEWEYQLNLQRYLLPYKVEKIQIIGFAKDWSFIKKRFNDSYPPSALIVVDIPMWSKEETEERIGECIDRLVNSENLSDIELPMCTDEERWKSKEVYAFYKGNSKKAKLYESQIEALEAKAKEPDSRIEVREGEAKRCQFCQVKRWCK